MPPEERRALARTPLLWTVALVGVGVCLLALVATCAVLARTTNPATPLLFVVVPMVVCVVVTVALWRERRRVRQATGDAIAGRWQPQRFATRGRPGESGFVVDAPGGVRHRWFDWRMVVHHSGGQSPWATDIPGTLFCDEIRGRRPRGLSLHQTADGSRTWRWHK